MQDPQGAAERSDFAVEQVIVSRRLKKAAGGTSIESAY